MMTSLGFSMEKNERLCDSLDIRILCPPPISPTEKLS